MLKSFAPLLSGLLILVSGWAIPASARYRAYERTEYVSERAKIYKELLDLRSNYFALISSSVKTTNHGEIGNLVGVLTKCNAFTGIFAPLPWSQRWSHFTCWTMHSTLQELEQKYVSIMRRGAAVSLKTLTPAELSENQNLYLRSEAFTYGCANGLMEDLSDSRYSDCVQDAFLHALDALTITWRDSLGPDEINVTREGYGLF